MGVFIPPKEKKKKAAHVRDPPAAARANACVRALCARVSVFSACARVCGGRGGRRSAAAVGARNVRCLPLDRAPERESTSHVQRLVDFQNSINSITTKSVPPHRFRHGFEHISQGPRLGSIYTRNRDEIEAVEPIWW